jgi:hypothetical protein
MTVTVPENGLPINYYNAKREEPSTIKPKFHAHSEKK